MLRKARRRKSKPALKFVGVELYFDDLKRGRTFYVETLGLKVTGEEKGHHAQFGGKHGFICLEKKGVENYPSEDKAVLFFEVRDIRAAIAAIGADYVVHADKKWAVLHDPEGHNILLLEAGRR